jgi:hypothetical protein
MKKAKRRRRIARLATKYIGFGSKKNYAALTILPPLIQRVQTFCRPFPPAGS